MLFLIRIISLSLLASLSISTFAANAATQESAKAETKLESKKAAPKSDAKLDPSSFYTNIETVPFTNQNNQALSFKDLQGKTVLFNFIFTQCSSVCPVQTKSLKEVQKSIDPKERENIVFVSVSLDPLGDTPAKLKKFTERMQVDTKNWHFVTSTPDGISRISARLALFKMLDKTRASTDLNDHATVLWLVDKKGQLMMRYNGAPVDVPRLIKELVIVNQM